MSDRLRQFNKRNKKLIKNGSKHQTHKLWALTTFQMVLVRELLDEGLCMTSILATYYQLLQIILRMLKRT